MPYSLQRRSQLAVISGDITASAGQPRGPPRQFGVASMPALPPQNCSRGRGRGGRPALGEQQVGVVDVRADAEGDLV